MKTDFEKWKVFDLRAEGFGYKKISKETGLSRDAVNRICLNRRVINPAKRGLKCMLGKKDNFRIKSALSRFNESKANSTKIIEKCQLHISSRSLQRYLKSVNVRYKCAKKVI